MGKLFRSFFAVTLVAILSACGGGGGSAGDTTGGANGGSSGGTTTNNGSIQLTLVDQAGAPSNLISGSGGLLAKALVLTNSGAPVGPGVLVTFSLDGTIAALSATAGTALTGSDGVAIIGLKAATGTGAGTLTASAIAVGTTAVTKSATFSVNSPANATPIALNFVAASPSDKSIVIKGAGGISRSEVALLTFEVVDATNVGISNVKVNFSMLPGTDAVLSATSGVTDPSGKVTVAVSSGATVTTIVVSAIVDGKNISNKSDTIAVTTGILADLHFGIYPASFNVEAYNHAGVENVISVSLGDVNSGVIANGTPVAFTSNAGILVGDNGTTDTARCLTVNGRCSIKWISGAPFSATPTVYASASNGLSVMQVFTKFTANSSFGAFSGLPSTVTFSSCVAQSFNFTVLGENGYSMPTGTTLAPLDMTNVTATVFPATVDAKAAAVQGGTTHSITITPTVGCPTGVGHLYLELTTPKGDKSGTSRINVVYP